MGGAVQELRAAGQDVLLTPHGLFRAPYLSLLTPQGIFDPPGSFWYDALILDFP